MESSGATALIASNLLKPKDNVLAVEVHLFSKYSKRSLFELTLEAPPVLPELMANATPAQQTEICQLLTEVGGLPGTVEILKTMQSNTSPDLQLRAAVAAALNELPISLKKRSDPAVAQALAQYVVALNLSAWNTVQRDDLTESQYVASLRSARAAHALSPLVHSQLKPLTEAVANTYAVALIRSGHYDKALEMLNKSIKQRGENPVDVAYVCLAHSRLGNTAEAQQARDQLAKLMESEDWRHNSEAQAAFLEIDRAFASSEKNP